MNWLRIAIFEAIPTCTLWRKVPTHPKISPLYWNWQFMGFKRTQIHDTARLWLIHKWRRGW